MTGREFPEILRAELYHINSCAQLTLKKSVFPSHQMMPLFLVMVLSF